jgi:hypothetical protein
VQYCSAQVPRNNGGGDLLHELQGAERNHTHIRALLSSCTDWNVTKRFDKTKLVSILVIGGDPT